MKKKTTPGWRTLMRHEPESKKRKLIQEESGAGYIPVIVFLHLQDIKRNTFQKLSVSLMFLNHQVLAPGHNTNIQTFSEKMTTHTRNHGLTTRLRLHRQTKIFCMDEKGVQVMTETGTMSAKCSILTDCDSLLYTGVTKEIFFTLVKLMKIENTFSFQLDVADQLLLVLMKLILSLLFYDLRGGG